MARAPQPAGFSTVPYDHIPLLPVNSRQLKAVGYDARRHILAAQFLHGAQAVYHYPNVTPELYAAFVVSDSKGTFFGQYLKALPFEKYPASVLQELPAPVPTTLGVAIAIAQKLHGLTYPLRIPKDVQEEAKAAGMVIVYGASDDLMEFDGAISDEIGACDGTTAMVDAKGPLPDWDSVKDEGEEAAADYMARKPHVREIHAIWCPKDMPDTSWAYETTIPHAVFDIMEDGVIYCRGIVFALAELAPKA